MISLFARATKQRDCQARKLLKCHLKACHSLISHIIDAHSVFQVQIFEYSLRIWWIRTIASKTDLVGSQHRLRIQTPFTDRSRSPFPSRKGVHWRTSRVHFHHQPVQCQRPILVLPARVTTTIMTFIHNTIMGTAVTTSTIWWEVFWWIFYNLLMSFF